MFIYFIAYFIFVHVSILVPGYALIKRTKFLDKKPGLQLCLAYTITIVLFAALATLTYVLNSSPSITRVICWILLLAGCIDFYKQRLWKDLYRLRLPIACTVMLSLISILFVSLSFRSAYTYIPDPTPQPNRNYQVAAVKTLNISQTPAIDNYIPYRQAQFFINRSDPAKDSFINEWGVHFFQRTPLMGAVTANYFNLIDDQLPINHTWSANSSDPDFTYAKFQIIASVLNSIFIIPAYFLLKRLFSKRVALISCLFFASSQFFLYSSIYSWPKSFVAFFVLLSWLLILEKQMRLTILAGVVSGIAYLTHDLALLYIGTSALLLLLSRRWKEIPVLLGTSAVFAIPWLLVSSLVYARPSSFILYPLSLEGIPQPHQKQQIIDNFFHTSPVRILVIKLRNLLYLLTPYQLFTSEGGQVVARRFWGLGLFSLPGSVGLSMAIAALCGLFKKMGNLTFWTLALTPILLSVVVIGWPKGLGIMHFAQVSVVLITALGLAYLLSLKRKFWLMGVYGLHVLQLGFLIVYSYGSSYRAWFSSFADILSLLIILGATVVSGVLIFHLAKGTKLAMLKNTE